MANKPLVRIAEAILEIARLEDFTDAVKVGIVSTVSATFNYRAELVVDTGTYKPVSNELVGIDAPTFSFTVTPEVQANMVANGLLPSTDDPSSFAPFHLRFRKNSGRGALKTFLELIDCVPSGVGFSGDAMSLGRASYNGQARIGRYMDRD